MPTRSTPEAAGSVPVAGPPNGLAARVVPRFDRPRFALLLVDLLMAAAIVAGGLLLFHRLAWNGSTWDERTDFRIAVEIAHFGGYLDNQADPTQARLPHIVGAGSLLLFDDDLHAFKLPFAVAGVCVGGLLFAFVCRRYGRRTGLYCLAFYATNPWMLASARSGGTAGDILLVLTTFAFFWVAVALVEAGRSWRFAHSCGFGLVAGMAVGAKLPSVVLVPLGLVLVVLFRRSVAHAVAFVAFASLVAVATHPILVLDPQRLVEPLIETLTAGPNPYATLEPRAAIPGGAGPDATVAAGVVPVSLEETPKLNYLRELLVGKLTAPFLLLLGIGLVVGIGDALRTRRFDAAFWGATAIVLGTCGILAWKYKQNANYFLPIVLPAITIAALPLARALRSAAPALRVAGALAWLVLVAYQLWLSVGLYPDFLQAGRRLGPQAQGLMAGPAVNHCQGTPLMIERLNRWFQTEPYADVPVFAVCNSLIGFDQKVGPVHPEGYRLVMYRSKSPPERPHLLVVHEIIHQYAFGEEVHAQRIRELAEVTRGCSLLEDQRPEARFKIYSCPSSESP